VNQRGDSLRVFGVGEAFEEAVGGAEDGKSDFRPVDEGGETFVMALAGFAEEPRADAAPGTKRFFDESHAFHANEAVFRRQTAAQSHAELLEPAIVAAGEERRAIHGRAVIASSFARCSHYVEGSKFSIVQANPRSILREFILSESES